MRYELPLLLVLVLFGAVVNAVDPASRPDGYTIVKVKIWIRSDSIGLIEPQSNGTHITYVFKKVRHDLVVSESPDEIAKLAIPGQLIAVHKLVGKPPEKKK